MTKIEQIADEISTLVFPNLSGLQDVEICSTARQVLAGAIMELALEIKRAALEGEW